MYVEIEDGYGANWGFSPGDAIADVVGASYYLGQYYFPVLKHIQPRVSYWPTDKVKSGDEHLTFFIQFLVVYHTTGTV